MAFRIVDDQAAHMHVEVARLHQQLRVVEYQRDVALAFVEALSNLSRRRRRKITVAEIIDIARSTLSTIERDGDGPEREA